MIRIALDAMGGDHGPSVVIPAALDALKENSNLEIVLVGDEAILQTVLKAENHPRLTIKHASQSVLMDESPASALRSKRDSSMRVAINLVKNKEVAACVSAGNTGALMAIAKFVLKMLPGINRPAIIYSLPTDAGATHGFVRMLDLGANVDCDAEHLVQFAVMGSVLTAALSNNPAPRVALLNIGSEAIKGRESIKKAAAILSESDTVNYVGYIEGTGIFRNKADVVVCDGFVGNVALKCTEGVASMLLRFLKREFNRNWYTKLSALLMMPILKRLSKRFDPAGYNGASLLGLNGIVIKSHGNAKRAGFKQAILEAITEAQENIPERIRTKVVADLARLEELEKNDGF